MPDLATLADYLSGLDASALPERVRAAARLHVLDAAAAAAAGRRSDLASALARVNGESGAAWEACVGAALAHRYEADDILDEALLCIGGLVVPTALALGRAGSASGAEVLAAALAGYEAMGRLGLALGSAPLLRRGWWPTAVCGAFGAAAVAGRLLGLDSARMAEALALGLQHSGGLGGGETGALGRCLLFGSCARAGILAARSAAAGLRGAVDLLAAPNPLAGAYGLVEVEPSRLTAALGEEFIVERAAIKPYPCARQLQAAAEAALALHARGVDIATAEQVVVDLPATSRGFDRPVGASPPASAAGSAQWVVATALLLGNVTPEGLESERALALAARVVVRFDVPELTAPLAGGVTVTGGGRAEHHAVPVPRGGVARPLGFDEVREKGRALAGATLGAGFDGLVDAIERLERLPSVEGLAGAVLDASPGAGLR